MRVRADRNSKVRGGKGRMIQNSLGRKTRTRVERTDEDEDKREEDKDLKGR